LNSLGAKFTEDFNAEYNESIALAVHHVVSCFQGPLGLQEVLCLENREQLPNRSWEPSRPPSPYICKVEQAEREAAERTAALYATVNESALYPVYRGYESAEFIRSLSMWIEQLEGLKTGYEVEVFRHFNWIQRTQLCQYSKLVRRIGRLVQALQALEVRLRMMSFDDGLPSEYRWLQRVLNGWVRKVTEQYERMTMKDAQGYRSPACRRDVMKCMGDEVMDLAFELKDGIQEHVDGILEILDVA
jgi:hypothetical protein